MWACDVIPGVSGGTIAFITGIYDSLLDSLRAITAMKRREINISFLVSLILGVMWAILTLANLVQRLIFNQPVMIWSLFLGLLLSSIRLVSKSVKHRSRMRYIQVLIWIIVWVLLTSFPLMQTEPNLVTVFFAAAIAIMAMILPGISWSYLLLMLNHYHYIINTIVLFTDAFKAQLAGETVLRWQLPRATLIVFVLWAVIWLLAFSRLLHWIKERYHDQMVAILCGFMIGAIHKVWPFKETVETYTDRHGDILPLIEKNILPQTTGDAIIWWSFALIGVWLVVMIHWLAGKRNKSAE